MYNLQLLVEPNINKKKIEYGSIKIQLRIQKSNLKKSGCLIRKNCIIKKIKNKRNAI